MIGVNAIQIHHIIKKKNSEGLSISAYIVVCIGLTCMGSFGLYYGILELYIPIFIQVSMVLYIIFLIFRYRKEEYGSVIVVNEITPINTMIEICIP